MSDYSYEAQGFQIEVEQLAAELIRDGVPPWDAVIQARRMVSARRARKAGAR